MPAAINLSRPSGERASGFTLVEMLVVLTVIALAMTAAPAIMAGLAGVRLRAAADEMTVQLRLARGLAMQRGAPVEVTFDLATRRYRLTGNDAAHALPSVVDAVTVTPKERLQPGDIARLRFLPDGSAETARIALQHGSSQKTIVIDWLTGRVWQNG